MRNSGVFFAFSVVLFGFPFSSKFLISFRLRMLNYMK